MRRGLSNIAVLGGVRGALSIVLAATVTVSAVISASDILTIRTMALGVAFLSIAFQVPLLFRYVRSRFKDRPTEQASKVDEKLSTVSASIEELRKLRAEEKISEQEFTHQLEEYKNKLQETLHESSVLMETRKIIHERASMIYSSVKKPSEGKAGDHAAGKTREKKLRPQSPERF
jgi:ABC-type transport system involved in cytochrome bd biosynthesis fused ATPase/permease subunit